MLSSSFNAGPFGTGSASDGEKLQVYICDAATLAFYWSAAAAASSSCVSRSSCHFFTAASTMQQSCSVQQPSLYTCLREAAAAAAVGSEREGTLPPKAKTASAGDFSSSSSVCTICGGSSSFLSPSSLPAGSTGAELGTLTRRFPASMEAAFVVSNTSAAADCPPPPLCVPIAIAAMSVAHSECTDACTTDLFLSFTCGCCAIARFCMVAEKHADTTDVHSNASRAAATLTQVQWLPLTRMLLSDMANTPTAGDDANTANCLVQPVSLLATHCSSISTLPIHLNTNSDVLSSPLPTQLQLRVALANAGSAAGSVRYMELTRREGAQWHLDAVGSLPLLLHADSFGVVRGACGPLRQLRWLLGTTDYCYSSQPLQSAYSSSPSAAAASTGAVTSAARAIIHRHHHPLLAVLHQFESIIGDPRTDHLTICVIRERQRCVVAENCKGSNVDWMRVCGEVVDGPWAVHQLTLSCPTFFFSTVVTSRKAQLGQVQSRFDATGSGGAAAAALVAVFIRPAATPYAPSPLLRSGAILDKNEAPLYSQQQHTLTVFGSGGELARAVVGGFVDSAVQLPLQQQHQQRYSASSPLSSESAGSSVVVVGRVASLVKGPHGTLACVLLDIRAAAAAAATSAETCDDSRSSRGGGGGVDHHSSYSRDAHRGGGGNFHLHLHSSNKKLGSDSSGAMASLSFVSVEVVQRVVVTPSLTPAAPGIMACLGSVGGGGGTGDGVAVVESSLVCAVISANMESNYLEYGLTSVPLLEAAAAPPPPPPSSTTSFSFPATAIINSRKHVRLADLWRHTVLFGLDTEAQFFSAAPADGGYGELVSCAALPSAAATEKDHICDGGKEAGEVGVAARRRDFCGGGGGGFIGLTRCGRICTFLANTERSSRKSNKHDSSDAIYVLSTLQSRFYPSLPSPFSSTGASSLAAAAAAVPTTSNTLLRLAIEMLLSAEAGDVQMVAFYFAVPRASSPSSSVPPNNSSTPLIDYLLLCCMAVRDLALVVDANSGCVLHVCRTSSSSSGSPHSHFSRINASRGSCGFIPLQLEHMASHGESAILVLSGLQVMSEDAKKSTHNRDTLVSDRVDTAVVEGAEEERTQAYVCLLQVSLLAYSPPPSSSVSASTTIAAAMDVSTDAELAPLISIRVADAMALAEEEEEEEGCVSLPFFSLCPKHSSTFTEGREEGEKGVKEYTSVIFFSGQCAGEVVVCVLRSSSPSSLSPASHVVTPATETTGGGGAGVFELPTLIFFLRDTPYHAARDARFWQEHVNLTRVPQVTPWLPEVVRKLAAGRTGGGGCATDGVGDGMLCVVTWRQLRCLAPLPHQQKKYGEQNEEAAGPTLSSLFIHVLTVVSGEGVNSGAVSCIVAFASSQCERDAADTRGQKDEVDPVTLAPWHVFPLDAAYGIITDATFIHRGGDADADAESYWCRTCASVVEGEDVAVGQCELLLNRGALRKAMEESDATVCITSLSDKPCVVVHTRPLSAAAVTLLLLRAVPVSS